MASRLLNIRPTIQNALKQKKLLEVSDRIDGFHRDLYRFISAKFAFCVS